MPTIRELASSVLKEVLITGRKPKDALEYYSAGVEGKDRAFLMELSYGAIRYRDTLDWMLKRLLQENRMPPSDTHNNLRAGLYQIFFMRTPDWAAVNESVNAEVRNKRLVNAVLRNALRKREFLESEIEKLKAAISGPSASANIAILTSHPEWMIKRWIKRFGVEETYSLATANNIVPSITLRVNTLKTNRDAVVERLEKMGIGCLPTSISPDGITLKVHISFKELEPLKGLIVAQDEAAQMVPYLLAPEPGERILDACAAPGGKSTHIAQLMKDTGEIIALDISRTRIGRLKENISNLGFKSVKPVEGDINSFSSKAPFDRIILDAPCTATGTIRRNPDVKYKIKRGDLARLSEIQLTMLRSASALLKPGGALLYCTCSTEPEEGEDVINSFLKTSEKSTIIHRDALAGERGVSSLEKMFENGFFRTYPHRHGMDGFFAVCVKKEI